MAIPDEYTAVRKVGFNPPNIAYFLSRSVFYHNIIFLCSSSLSTPLDSALFSLVLPPLLEVTASRMVWLTDWHGVIVAPIDNCGALQYVEGIFAEIAIPATSLLFFFRVRAIYNQCRIITAFFGVLWLSIAGLSIMIMLGITKGAYTVVVPLAMTNWFDPFW